MRMTCTVTIACTAAALTFLSTVPVTGYAEEGGPPKLSTNPANHVIFPAKDQSPEQMEKDQLAAYTWASKQTNWDPYKANAELAAKGYVADKTVDATRGQAVKGAAGGALLGAVIGSLSGDAGEGAAIGAAAGGLTQGLRARRVKSTSNAGMEAAVDGYKRQFELWDRNFVAAMEGKGYTVK